MNRPLRHLQEYQISQIQEFLFEELLTDPSDPTSPLIPRLEFAWNTLNVVPELETLTYQPYTWYTREFRTHRQDARHLFSMVWYAERRRTRTS